MVRIMIIIIQTYGRTSWYLNETDQFEMIKARISWYLMGLIYLRLFRDVSSSTSLKVTNLRRRKDVPTGT